MTSDVPLPALSKAWLLAAAWAMASSTPLLSAVFSRLCGVGEAARFRR